MLYGRGHFIHSYWTDRLFNYLRAKRYNPKKEYHVDGKIADIAYRKDGKLVFVEVEYGSNWRETITMAYGACDRLVLVVVRAEKMPEVGGYLKAKGFTNVTVTDPYYCFTVLP